jgi:large subunit ribosomal protein L3
MTTQNTYPEGLLGRKLGMTQVYTTEGESVPVTVIQAGPCFVLGVKSDASDGRTAVQLGFEPKKNQRVSKPEMGNFAKAGQGAFYHVQEMRCDVERLGWSAVGKELRASDVFADGDMVDVSGMTIGRGFSGVFRRYGFKGQPASNGTHEVERHGGSIGCRKFPGRVIKGQKMPGHHGNAHRTVMNLKVMGIRPEENLLLVRGAVPGGPGSLVMIRKAIKTYKPAKAAA